VLAEPAFGEVLGERIGDLWHALSRSKERAPRHPVQVVDKPRVAWLSERRPWLLST